MLKIARDEISLRKRMTVLHICAHSEGALVAKNALYW